MGLPFVTLLCLLVWLSGCQADEAATPVQTAVPVQTTTPVQTAVPCGSRVTPEPATPLPTLEPRDPNATIAPSATIEVLPTATACPTVTLLGEQLSFETIERLDASGTGILWESREPGLVILTNADEVAQLDSLITEDAEAQLRQVDFDANFVAAVFLGWQPNIHEGLTIERVVRQGNLVTLDAQVGELGGQAATSSPYHLIQVRKEANWNQDIEFVLLFDGQPVLQHSQHIP